MLTIRITATILLSFNAVMVVAMMILSSGQVYALMCMAILLMSAVVVSQAYRRHLLMKTLQNHFSGLFVVLVMFSLYYTCFAVVLVAYFETYSEIPTRFSMIMITNLGREMCVWLNLAFYMANAILYWIYTQRYYVVFWVDTVREIFKIMRRESHELSSLLMNRLKPIPVPDDLLRIECPLCLEKYSLVHQVSRLPCRHTFHMDCIRTWLYQKLSCPLCRGSVILH